MQQQKIELLQKGREGAPLAEILQLWANIKASTEYLELEQDAKTALATELADKALSWHKNLATDDITKVLTALADDGATFSYDQLIQNVLRSWLGENSTKSDKDIMDMIVFFTAQGVDCATERYWKCNLLYSFVQLAPALKQPEAFLRELQQKFPTLSWVDAAPKGSNVASQLAKSWAGKIDFDTTDRILDEIITAHEDPAEPTKPNPALEARDDREGRVGDIIARDWQDAFNLSREQMIKLIKEHSSKDKQHYPSSVYYLITVANRDGTTPAQLTQLVQDLELRLSERLYAQCLRAMQSVKAATCFIQAFEKNTDQTVSLKRYQADKLLARAFVEVCYQRKNIKLIVKMGENLAEIDGLERREFDDLRLEIGRKGFELFFSDLSQIDFDFLFTCAFISAKDFPAGADKITGVNLDIASLDDMLPHVRLVAARRLELSADVTAKSCFDAYTKVKEALDTTNVNMLGNELTKAVTDVCNSKLGYYKREQETLAASKSVFFKAADPNELLLQYFSGLHQKIASISDDQEKGIAFYEFKRFVCAQMVGQKIDDQYKQDIEKLEYSDYLDFYNTLRVKFGHQPVNKPSESNCCVM